MGSGRKPLALALFTAIALAASLARADTGVALRGVSRLSATSTAFPVANGVEQRVLDIKAEGGTVCGEPLNGPETAEAGTLEDGDVSAASSPTDECWGRGASYDTFNTDGGVHQMVAVSNWGSSQYALQQGAGYIWLRGLQPNTIGAGNKTLCYRYYKRIPASGYGSAGGQFGSAAGACAAGEFWRSKLVDFYFSGAADAGEVQVQEDPYFPGEDGNCYTDGTYHPISVGLNNQTQYLLSPTTNLGACRTAPCRVEMCLSGALSTGQNINITAYLTPLATGVTSQVSIPQTNFAGGPVSPWLWGGNLYRGQANAGALHNHFVQAIWNDLGPHTIGAAVEVEGSPVAGDTTPPATPTSLTGTPASGQMGLSWSHPNIADVDEFVVEYRCPQGTGSYVESTPRPTGTTRTVTGLVNGTPCDFRVAAEDVANNRSAYASIQATPTGGGGSPSFPVASGVEQLCTNLGANCLCSEPMNTNENGGAGLTDQWDFASSSNATECGHNRSTANSTIALANPTLPVMAAVTDWGSAGYALRSGSGAAWFTTGRKITEILDGTEKQLCWRWYKRVSSDYGNTCDVGGGQRNKIGQTNYTNGAQNNQPEELNCSNPCSAGTNYCPIIIGNDIPPPGGGWEGNVNLSPLTTWDAFKAKPARIEYCVESRDAGGVKGGNKLTFRMRIKRLDTGVISSGTTPETTGWGAPSLWDAWGNDEDHTGPGNGFMNFFIQTKSTADPDVTTHWPGCSQEVEGDVACPIPGGD